MDEAAKMIQQAGYKQGQILVLTSSTPSKNEMNTASKLANEGIFTSIMPMLADQDLNPLFGQFAQAGQGSLVPYSTDSSDLASWLTATNQQQFTRSKEDDIPLWRDEGRWFIIPALLFLLPVFRRGWLQR